MLVGGVTKEHYLEMCKMMGTEPVEDEIPVEITDLPYQAQTAAEIYSYLRDRWESFSGAYLGKDLSNIKEVFEIWNVEIPEYKIIFIIINMIDNIRASNIMKTNSK